MSLQDLLAFHQNNQKADAKAEKDLLGAIADKAHETNSYLLKRFNMMCLLSVIFFLCQYSHNQTIKGFGFEFQYSPTILLVIATFYAYQLMLWSYTSIDDIHLTYILHKQPQITEATGDAHLLHFEKFPLSIFCTENVIQAHFRELQLNPFSRKLNQVLAVLTFVLLYGLGIYLPIAALIEITTFHILQLILIPASLLLTLTAFINLARAREIQKQWDS